MQTQDPTRPGMICWPLYWHAVTAKRNRRPLWVRLAPSNAVLVALGAAVLAALAMAFVL